MVADGISPAAFGKAWIQGIAQRVAEQIKTDQAQKK